MRRVVRSGSAGTARSRRKTASTASHVEAQNAIYVAPWAISFLLVLPLGQILHLMWADSPWQWLAQVGMVIAVGCSAYVGWLSTKARSSLALGHTVATILLTGIWLLLCSETGWIGLHHVEWADWRVPYLITPAFDIYVLGTLVLCFLWNLRQGIHAKEAKDAALQGDTMDEWGEAGVPGIRGTLKKKNEFFLEGTLTLPRGMTIRDVQIHSERIESAKDWPSKSLTVLPKFGMRTARSVLARVMLKDPLAEAASWSGVKLKPKQTLFDPIPTGIRADGKVSTVFVATKDGAKHFLVQGQTGSGKLLRVSTPVPTPTGWTTMGDLRVGDEVFDEQGSVCRVTEAHAVQHDHPCLEVVFSDGEVIEAGPEHLWYTEDRQARTARCRARCLDSSRQRRLAIDAAIASELRQLACNQSEVTLDEVCVVAGIYSTSSLAQRAKRSVRSCGRLKISVPYRNTVRPVIKSGARLFPSSALVESLIREGSVPLHDQRHRRATGKVRTTLEISQSLQPPLDKQRGTVQLEMSNHSIPVAKALQLPEADLPVPPYVFGAWLGDGTSGSGGMTSADPEISDFIRCDGYVTSPVWIREGNKAVQYTVYGLVTDLKTLDVVKTEGTKGNREKSRKHIPLRYLRSSETQRRALLAGLMDTDGTPEQSGASVYTSTNKRLAFDVLELSRSLGYRATIRKGFAKINGRVVGDAWDVAFTTSDDVFRLTRKRILHKERTMKHNPEKTLHRYIVDVRPAGTAEMRCISVDSPSHLYLAGHAMIPTHNTIGQNPVLLYTAALGAVNIVIDTKKKTQSYGPIAPALHWLITEEGLAKAVLKRIAEVVIPARTEQLARERLPQWHPRSSMPFLRLQVEEAWSVVDSDHVDEIAKAARSAGIQLVVSLQRASHTEMSTVVRGQLGTRFCYGLGDGFGTMILDDDVIDAGADPTKWKDEQPGMHYMTRGGLTIAEKATPVRSYIDDGPITFEQAAIQIAPKLVEVDTVTTNALGVLWTNRIAPVDLVNRVQGETPATPPSVSSRTTPSPNHTSPTPTTTLHPAAQAVLSTNIVPPSPPVVGQHDKVELSEDELQVIMTMSEDGRVVTFSGDGLPDDQFIYNEIDLEPDFVMDMDDPIVTPSDHVPLQLEDQTKEKVSQEKLTEMMQSRFTALITEGMTILTSADFAPVVLESGGWTRTIVYKYLAKWVTDGVLEKEEGVGWHVLRRELVSSE